MPSFKSQDNEGEIEYTLEIDEDMMEILHDALHVYLQWIHGDLESFPVHAGTEDPDHPGVDVMELIGPALYVRSKDLRQKLVSLVGRDLAESTVAEKEESS